MPPVPKSIAKGILLLCLVMAASVGLTVSVAAQVTVGALAQDVCRNPPMARDHLDRLKRRSDYARLLEELADNCPDVALVFLDFEVGSIDGREEDLSFDPFAHFAPLEWPVPADRNF